MLRWIGDRLRGDDGVSLVEMLVAMLLVGFVLMAMAATTTSSLAAIQRNERQTRATQFGNQIMDEMQSLTWANLAFYAGDSPPATFEGRTTVIRSGSRPAGSPAPLPTRTITTPEGVVYTVTTHVTWVDDTADGVSPADTKPNDYKRLTLLLSWQARGVTRTQRFDSNRSLPREIGAATNPFTITSNVVSPDPVFLNASKQSVVSATNPAAAPVTVSVTVSRAASSVVLQYRPRSVATWTTAPAMSSDAAKKVWTYTFPSGQTWTTEGYWEFRYTATSPSAETDVNEESVWIATTPEAFVTIQNLGVTPATNVATQDHTSNTHDYKPICDIGMTFTVTRSDATNSIALSHEWTSYYGTGAPTDTVAATGGPTNLPSWGTNPAGLTRDYSLAPAIAAFGPQMPGNYVVFTVRGTNTVTGDTDFASQTRTLTFGTGSCT